MLTDFGLSELVDSPDFPEFGLHTAPTATFEYSAPEVLDFGESHSVGPASDVYSFGCVVWELMAGRRPWDGRVSHAVMWEVGNGGRLEVEEAWPAAVKEMVQGCFCTDPLQRPTAEQLFACVHAEMQRVMDL